MGVEVRMPQMGESVTEGTILKWLVKEGERVEKDQPLFEISTDKVDAEIPSPSSGVLERIDAPEGTTVEVGKVVALLSEGESAPSKGKSAKPEPVKPAPVKPAPVKPEPAKPATAAAPSAKPAAPKPASPKPAPKPAAAAPPGPPSEGALVKMPQMGESVAEGTIIKWLVRVGDRVEKDAPLFEISTDKVDAEIPSPEAGVLAEILVGEGETVEVGRAVARLGGAAAGAGSAAASEAGAIAAASRTPEAPRPASKGEFPATPPAAFPPAASVGRDIRSSPLARRIAREQGIDLKAVEGTGRGGRVSKKDVLALAGGPGSGGATPSTAAVSAAGLPAGRAGVEFAAGEESVTQPMSNMRKKIAEHMTASKRTAPHVLTVFEVDVTRAERIRAAAKAAFEARHGARLTLTTMVVHAIVPVLLRYPVLNSSVVGETVVYHKGIHMGVAVALDEGLIVPVIKGAERLGIGEIARSLQDLSGRARSKKLVPDEVHGATFTITNPGIFGGLFSFPVINQPNVAILGVGGSKKRPVVVDDAIAIRDIVYFSLSFDHRAIDGAVADQFMSEFRERIENFPEEALA
ncbi:MAG: 2-oxoglutarate dehydrogenase, E2 component, dihydrolipoamide succinyltransferase [Candidatus Latescibacterota bacterium]|nr:MAG: 2-oxoglutarate dehydrogenase, E2 component, dihydrolipoamide succinyltransferase [Candidatus Latescibacterota bacterium]